MTWLVGVKESHAQIYHQKQQVCSYFNNLQIISGYLSSLFTKKSVF